MLTRPRHLQVQVPPTLQHPLQGVLLATAPRPLRPFRPLRSTRWRRRRQGRRRRRTSLFRLRARRLSLRLRRLRVRLPPIPSRPRARLLRRRGRGRSDHTRGQRRGRNRARLVLLGARPRNGFGDSGGDPLVRVLRGWHGGLLSGPISCRRTCRDYFHVSQALSLGRTGRGPVSPRGDARSGLQLYRLVGCRRALVGRSPLRG